MKRYFWPLPGMILAVLFAGCGSRQQGGMPPMPPPEVSVMKVASQNLPVTTELPGRVDAVRTAQVRARATGILLKQVYKEGSDVKEGDVLFQIDPAPLQAGLDSAKAALAKARANLEDAHIKAQRYKALAEIHAVSKQDYDDANALGLQAKADVEAAKAAVEVAQLNLGYATVTAPISGHIGPSLVTEGALVSQTDATPMALIQQMDPIYFDFTESSADALRLKALFDKGQLQKVADNEAKVTLILEDGSVYSHPGRLLFSDITVDQSTGMITLRSEFPNPEHLLLPGMFARCRLEQAVASNAIAVLQRVVSLGANGTASVMVVDQDNKVQARPVKLGQAIGDKWIVTGGLQPGDVVVVEGLQKVRPGMEVKTTPFHQDLPNRTGSL